MDNNAIKLCFTITHTIKIHKNQQAQMMVDNQAYHTRVNLATYFKGIIKKEPKPYIPNSNWAPNLRLLPSIRSLIRVDTVYMPQENSIGQLQIVRI